MKSLEVLLSDVPVGELRSRADGRIAFRFLDGYRRLDRRPVLGQCFEDDLERAYLGKKPGDLPAFFAHLLPEGKLRAVLEESLLLESASDAELLAAVGNDLPGAVRIRPVGDEAADPAGVLDEASEPKRVPDRHDPEADGGFRFSLAGVQMKFSLLRRAERFTAPASHQTGDWIVKLAIARFESMAENEHATMEWARKMGFAVPPCSVVETSTLGELARYAPRGTRAFAVARFDRARGTRVHQEDIAQVMARVPKVDGTERYSSTYEIVGALVRGIVGEDACREFVRRLAFVVGSGNNDAHLKNWSLTYPDTVTPTLAPLYDQLATVAWPELDRTLALKLAGARDFGRISADSFAQLARRIGLAEQRTLEDVREVIAAAKRTWDAGAAEVFPPAHATAIRDHWQRVPLLREAGSLAG